jgi:hypothetical protein
MQNALNLNREPANSFGLNISDIVTFTTAVAVITIAVKVVLRVELAALFLPLLNILGLSSYSIIEDG